ncbi:MAG: RIP metalloprotease RseP [Burkholderiales bacterium]|jgi:regulator of sigma E protease
MIDILWKVASFAIVLGVLVVFHELGHYAVARLAGVRILRFSVGFGRVVWSRFVGADRTEWALSLIPLGGYVKMLDEREGRVAPADVARAFNRQSVWKRIAIVAAGPIANLVLAVLLFAASYVAGVPGQRALFAEPPPASPAAAAGIADGDTVIAVDGVPVRSLQDLRWRIARAQGADAVMLDVRERDGATAERRLALGTLDARQWEGDFMPVLGLRADLGSPLVDEVVADKPAARAGMQKGDRIVAIDGAPMRSPAAVAAVTNAHPLAPMMFRVLRDGRTIDIAVTPEAGEAEGRRVGIAGLRLRVDPAEVDKVSIVVRYGPGEALVQASRRTGELAVFTLRMLGRIVVGDASVKNISGPITLADYAGQSAKGGLLSFASFIALVSISLGVLNLLPIPLLDGGHLLYYFAEFIKGAPISDRAFEVGQRIGMAILAVLMTLALFNDVSRLF